MGVIVACLAVVIAFTVTILRDRAAPSRGVETTQPPTTPMPSEAGELRLPASLIGYRQGQLLCRSGGLVDRVSKVVLDPDVAIEGGPGDCTLADMKEFNPETEFYAYVNIGSMKTVDPRRGPFQNTCVDPSTEGRAFTVSPDNPRVSTNEEGYAIYPDYSSLVVADLSPGYADACVSMIELVLSTPSAPRITPGAPSVTFDGLYLDDVNMSPAHAQDISEIGPWGPWEDDAAYGHAMTSTVARISDGIDRKMGRDVPLWINLGMDALDPGQVERATELAQSGVADYALREFTVATASGVPISDIEMSSKMQVHRALAEAGLPVIQDETAISMRALPLPSYEQGRIVPESARCLDQSIDDWRATKQAVIQRRQLDHRMLLGHTLLTRTRSTPEITATWSQAPPSCQATETSAPPMAENVDEASVLPSDVEVNQLTQALNDGAYAVSDVKERNGIWHQRLSDGQAVLINTRTEVQDVVLYGRHYEVPGRSAIIDRP